MIWATQITLVDPRNTVSLNMRRLANLNLANLSTMLGDSSPEIVLIHTDYLTIIINSLQSVLAQVIHHRLDQRCGMNEQPQALLCRCLALKLSALQPALFLARL